MKQTLTGKKVLLLPNTKSTDLMDNTNLLTNTIIRMTNMLQGYGVESITLNPSDEYDVVVARHITTYETNIINLDKTKPAVIFNFNAIDGSFCFDASVKDSVVFNNLQQESEGSPFWNTVENPDWDIVDNNFYIK